MELVVLSGKGGTGKTTIATALTELEKNVIRIDCDVDAPNLYLFYKGKDIEKTGFIGSKKASIDENLCIKCGKCKDVCKFDAIDNFEINSFLCEGCGACMFKCPTNAIALLDEKIADTFITQIDNEILSRAEMEIGADGSGKLITQLRKNGKRFNKDEKLTIIDGSPGIGCPVISSITNSDIVLIVTEPTKSGLEDLMRVVSLCKHFGVLVSICINKYDINEKMTLNITKYVEEKGLKLVGKIPYDDTVQKSINELKPITCYEDSIANKAIVEMWKYMKNIYKI